MQLGHSIGLKSPSRDVTKAFALDLDIMQLRRHMHEMGSITT